MAADMISEQLRSYLETCSPEVMKEIVEILGFKIFHYDPDAAEVEDEDDQVESDAAGIGPKRPLNSWMAFRKFYNTILAGSTQKSISRVLTVLWQAEPFVTKWSNLAKAYSIIRGCREKKDAPLDQFLKICAPFVGVIPPGEYLERMGWQLSAPIEGDKDKTPQVIRIFIPELDALVKDFPITAASVDDILKHCYIAGYANWTPQHRPAGQVTLEKAAAELEKSGATYPYYKLFDPADPEGLFNVSFDPAAPDNLVEDGGRFDAYDLNELAARNGNIDGNASSRGLPSAAANANAWTEFMNEPNAF